MAKVACSALFVKHKHRSDIWNLSSAYFFICNTQCYSVSAPLFSIQFNLLVVEVVLFISKILEYPEFTLVFVVPPLCFSTLSWQLVCSGYILIYVLVFMQVYLYHCTVYLCACYLWIFHCSICYLKAVHAFFYPATQKVAGYFIIPSESFECPSVRQRFISRL